MAEKEVMNKTAKAALTGGLISIILSPISIVLAYYLGTSLSSPEIQVKYVVPVYDYKNLVDDIYSLPEEVIKPLRVDFELLDIMQKTQGLSDIVWGSIVDDLKTNEIYKSDEEDLVRLMETILEYLKVNKELKTDERVKTLTDLKEYFLSKIEEIKSDEKIRTGKSRIKIGVLNSGQTDDVIFPEGKLFFRDEEIIIKNVGRPGYKVITPHSFEELNFIIDTVASSAGSVAKWRSIITQENILDFTILIKTENKEYRKEGELVPDQ